MKVVAIANQKGGVGKSTLACNLAVNASKDGQKTLIIDADVQGSSISFRAMRETDDLQAVSITTPTIHKDINNFANFDLVIVDAGGRDNTLFRSAIMAAASGILLIPVLPSQMDIWAAEDTFGVLREARTYVDINAYTVLNRLPAGSNINKDAKDVLVDLAQEHDVSILNTNIYARVEFMKSISEGLGVIESQPSSKAAQEANELYAEIKNILNI